MRTSVRTPRHARGFTLVELGIVIAVIAVMVSLMLPNLRGHREASLRKKLDVELVGLGDAVHAYWARRVRLEGQNLDRTWRDAPGGPMALGAGVTGVLDLSNAAHRDKLRDFLPPEATGLNPYQKKYELLLQQRRIAVRTCVPPGDFGAMLAENKVTIACSGTSCPGDAACEVTYAKPVLPGRLPDVAMEKKYLHWGAGGSTLYNE